MDELIRELEWLISNTENRFKSAEEKLVEARVEMNVLTVDLATLRMRLDQVKKKREAQ